MTASSPRSPAEHTFINPPPRNPYTTRPDPPPFVPPPKKPAITRATPAPPPIITTTPVAVPPRSRESALTPDGFPLYPLRNPNGPITHEDDFIYSRTILDIFHQDLVGLNHDEQLAYIRRLGPGQREELASIILETPQHPIRDHGIFRANIDGLSPIQSSIRTNGTGPQNRSSQSSSPISPPLSAGTNFEREDRSVDRILDFFDNGLSGLNYDEQLLYVLQLPLQEREELALLVVRHPEHRIRRHEIFTRNVTLLSPGSSRGSSVGANNEGVLSPGVSDIPSPVTTDRSSLASAISSNGDGPRYRYVPVRRPSVRRNIQAPRGEFTFRVGRQLFEDMRVDGAELEPGDIGNRKRKVRGVEKAIKRQRSMVTVPVRKRKGAINSFRNYDTLRS